MGSGQACGTEKISNRPDTVLLNKWGYRMDCNPLIRLAAGAGFIPSTFGGAPRSRASNLCVIRKHSRLSQFVQSHHKLYTVFARMILPISFFDEPRAMIDRTIRSRDTDDSARSISSGHPRLA